MVTILMIINALLVMDIILQIVRMVWIIRTLHKGIVAMVTLIQGGVICVIHLTLVDINAIQVMGI